MSKNPTIWLSSMNCLSCSDGIYGGYTGGYDTSSKPHKTLPCDKCGDIQNASMKQNIFLNKVKERDDKLSDQ